MSATQQMVSVDQKGASAGSNLVGGNFTVNTYFSPPTLLSSNVILQLLVKLKEEVATDAKAQDTIDSLQYYDQRPPRDGIVGLEAKLKAGGREEELYNAFDKKEQFAKLLDRWSLYTSAQKIFAHLLAKVETLFNMIIHPNMGVLDKVAINQLIIERILIPTVAECGCDVIVLNDGIVLGMLYWLAERCFVRWHP